MKKTLTKRFAALCAVFALMAVLVLPATVLADSPALRSVDVTVQLQEDGSAVITEVWDVRVVTGTEFYLGKADLDNMQISGLSVTDENGATFTDVGAWDVDKSIDQKAGTSGILRTGTGYELCWGVGSYGDHTYTVTYTMTNVVKGYEGGDAITSIFVTDGMMTRVDDVTINFYYGDTPLEYPETRVWVFGFSADYGFEDGNIWVQSDMPMETSQYAAVMVVFEPGMFSPTDVRGDDIQSIIDWGMEGSSYTPGDDTYDDGYYGGDSYSGTSSFTWLISPIFIVTFIGIIFSWVFVLAKKGAGGTAAGGHSKKQYRGAPYSRDLPFGGDLAASFVRLQETGGLASEGDIIGSYILRWVRTRQIEIVKTPAGVFKNKEEESLKLYTARPDMEHYERRLYDMLCKAAGDDWILQSKEFEKWSRRNYAKLESWFDSYKNSTKKQMEAGGVYALTEHATFFGLIKTKTYVPTPMGDELTLKMYGFKNYLKDFTIINEREAREVDLWDEYLVFAQLMGIADEVAKQFKELYPSYFFGYNTGTAGLSTYDMLWLMHISHHYSHAGYRGYRSGYNAAHSSSGYSGGGGHSSFGGGGGFSGGGGGGGSR